MVDFLNDDIVFKGELTAEDELLADGGLIVGAGGAHYGRPPSELANTWRQKTRIQVANVAQRDALVAWRAANDPITASNPLFVWRADGAYYSGLDEMTIDGSFWTAESAMAGDIEPMIGSVVPTGWVTMEGQIVTNAQTEFPALWANAHPSLRVGSGIRIPDMRGRVPIGAGTGPSLSARNIGDLVGAETVALTIAQLAAHTHTGTTGGVDRTLNHNHNVSFQNILGNNPSGTAFNFKVAGSGDPVKSTSVLDTTSPTAGPTLNHQHPFITASAGSGQGHPNVQPSTVVNFKVKL